MSELNVFGIATNLVSVYAIAISREPDYSREAFWRNNRVMAWALWYCPVGHVCFSDTTRCAECAKRKR